VADRKVSMIGLRVEDQDVAGVSEVLRSGMLVQGPQVAKLEEAFAARVGVRHCVAVNSGTAALHAMLAALDLRPGDEVITTSLSFAATANMILACGATPRFADVELETYNLDPASVAERVGPRTRAVLAVDLFGRLADYPVLREAAPGVPVLADACQAVGARDAQGREAGAHALASAFSLYATKNWQCGEGGLVTTDDDAVAGFCRRFRHHGQEPGGAYDYRHLGFNYRMTDYTARLAREQLRLLDEGNTRRRELALRYSALLAGLEGVSAPRVPAAGHAHHQFTIRVQGRRDQLRRALAEAGIATQIYYPAPLTQLPHLGSHPDRGAVPRADQLCREVLSLPLHPKLLEADVEQVAGEVRRFFATTA
jgi:perosamine synthetase